MVKAANFILIPESIKGITNFIGLVFANEPGAAFGELFWMLVNLSIFFYLRSKMI